VKQDFDVHITANFAKMLHTKNNAYGLIFDQLIHKLSMWMFLFWATMYSILCRHGLTADPRFQYCCRLGRRSVVRIHGLVQTGNFKICTSLIVLCWWLF